MRLCFVISSLHFRVNLGTSPTVERGTIIGANNLPRLSTFLQQKRRPSLSSLSNLDMLLKSKKSACQVYQSKKNNNTVIKSKVTEYIKKGLTKHQHRRSQTLSWEDDTPCPHISSQVFPRIWNRVLFRGNHPS